MATDKISKAGYLVGKDKVKGSNDLNTAVPTVDKRNTREMHKSANPSTPGSVPKS